MPVEISWFLQNRIVLVQFHGNVSIEEIGDAAQQTKVYLEQCDAPLLHTLHDASDLKSLPHNLKAIRDATEDGFKEPRVGWIVAYDLQDRLVSFLGNTMMQIFRMRYRIVDTQGEALDFLNLVDSTLPPLRSVAEERARQRQNPA